MGILEAALLGLVQGLTEFLPVSSSGHLVLAERLLGITQSGLAFEIWLHVATLFAVAAALAREIGALCRGLVSPADPAERTRSWQFVLAIVVGTIPAALVGLTAKEAIEGAFASIRWVGVDLLFTALVLAASRAFPGGQRQANPLRGFLVGVAQAVAILPGVSRSGMTLTAGLALGFSPAEAVRFSFLLAVPAILGAVVLDFAALRELGAASPGALGAGFVTAALSGIVAIRLVWRLMQQGRLQIFAPYCALLGLAALLLG